MRKALRLGYAPLMLVGFIAGAIATVANEENFWLMPLLIAAIAVSFVVERIIPYETAWNHPQGDSGRDIVHAIVNEMGVYASAASIPLLTLLMPWPSIWPVDWPLWGLLLVAVFVADFGITMCHWLSHRTEWLWRFHAVHHSVKRMYGFNGLLKHPLHQALEVAARTLPLVLAGMPYSVGLLLGFAVAIQLLLQHSNADMKIGPLRYLLALAPAHRFHHQKWGGVGDVNFGLFTYLWDHLLGTAAYDADKRFTSDDLGIGKQPDCPSGYVAQLVAPLRPQPQRYDAE